MPGFDESKRSAPAYSDVFNQQRNQALQERADLQAKFIATYPDYPKIAEVRRERWMNLWRLNELDKALAEADDLLKQPGHENDPEALHLLAASALEKDQWGVLPEQQSKAVKPGTVAAIERF